MAKKTTKNSKRRRRVPSDEQRVTLMLWNKDNQPWIHDGNGGEALPLVSVGRTNSKRGLGFQVVMQPLAEPPGAEPVAKFVLDRVQITRLHAYLEAQLKRIVAD